MSEKRKGNYRPGVCKDCGLRHNYFEPCDRARLRIQGAKQPPLEHSAEALDGFRPFGDRMDGAYELLGGRTLGLKGEFRAEEAA